MHVSGFARAVVAASCCAALAACGGGGGGLSPAPVSGGAASGSSNNLQGAHYSPQFTVYSQDYPFAGTLPGHPAYSLAITPSGGVVFPDLNYGIIGFENGTYTQIAPTNKQYVTPEGTATVGSPSVGVNVNAVDSSGRVYADAALNGQPAYLADLKHPATATAHLLQAAGASANPSDMEFTRDGRLLVLGSTGLDIFTNPASTNPAVQSWNCGSSCNLLRVADGVDNHIYVYATGNTGTLYQLSETGQLVSSVQLPANVRSITPDTRGGIWFADQTSASSGTIGYVSAAMKVSTYPVAANVDLIATASDGSVWLTGNNESTLYLVASDGSTMPFAMPVPSLTPPAYGFAFKGAFGTGCSVNVLWYNGPGLVRIKI